jgi:LacI family transcriptional regulator
MRVTIKDIAKQLNLNNSTVSRILNGKDFPVRPETYKLVIDTAKEMGYRRNNAAKALVTGRTNFIAFWTSDLAAYNCQSVANHFQRIIRRDKYEMISYEFGRHLPLSTTEAGYYGLDVDGILALGGGTWLNSFLETHGKEDTPVVSVSPEISSPNRQVPVDFISVDTYTPARQILEQLVTVGCRSIVFVYGTSWDCRIQRGNAYRDVLKEAGIEPIYLSAPNGSRLAARTSIKEYIAENGCPDAVFCNNDNMAIGVYRGLLDIGVKVPDDVAIVGCDGNIDTEYLEVPISTIILPSKEIAQSAWELLLRRINDRSIPAQKMHLTARLEMRESTRWQRPENRS